MDVNFDSTLGMPYTGANITGTLLGLNEKQDRRHEQHHNIGRDKRHDRNNNSKHHDRNNNSKRHRQEERNHHDRNNNSKHHRQEERKHHDRNNNSKHHDRNNNSKHHRQEERKHHRQEERKHHRQEDNFLQKLPKMNMLIILVVIIIAVYAIFSSLGDNSSGGSIDSSILGGETSGNTSDNASGKTKLDILLWGIFITLVLLNGVSYFFNFNINASLKNLFSGKPELDIIVDPDDIIGDTDKTATSVPELTFRKQVFNVPNNKYNYEDAKAVCRAYGGRLATYKEVEDAYNDGADWCGFGWSDGQMALYPTQMEKWQTLQKIKGHEHDCGRPGVNGGYIANPNVRFGINCYGYKPKITQEETQLMSETSLYPKTQKELDFEKRVYHWKDKISEILVAPFNHNNWSIN